nr:MAG TPA: hypothetical protein [Caudoviricetes sp.]
MIGLKLYWPLREQLHLSASPFGKLRKPQNQKLKSYRRYGRTKKKQPMMLSSTKWLQRYHCL